MFETAVRDRLSDMRGIRRSDVLSALGLAPRWSSPEMILPAAGLFLAGVIVGTGCALMMAPSSGEEMRRNIRGKARELKRRAGGAINDGIEELQGAGESVRDRVNEGGRRIERAANSLTSPTPNGK